MVSVRLVGDRRLIQLPLRKFSGRSMELHGLPSGVPFVRAGFAIWLAVPTNEEYPEHPHHERTDAVVDAIHRSHSSYEWARIALVY